MRCVAGTASALVVIAPAGKVSGPARWTALALGAAVALQLAACASPTLLRADPSLQTSNPMREIALIGHGHVVLPTISGKPPSLSLTHSRAGIEAALPLLEQELEKRGYDVVFAQPAGIGYGFARQAENTVYDYEAAKGEPDVWTIPQGEVAYEYAVTKENPELATAVRQAFTQMEAAIGSRGLAQFSLSKGDLDLLQQATGAGTICLVRTWGRQYTAARKVGTFLLSALVGPGTMLQDAVEIFMSCSDAASGKLLWQHGAFAPRSARDLEVAQAQLLLKYFPAAGAPLQAGCTPSTKLRLFMECSEPEDAKQVAMAAQAAPPEPTAPAEQALPAAQVQQIFAGKLVEGRHLINQRDLRHFYGPNGELIGGFGKPAPTTGRWRATPAGLCLRWEGQDERCERVRLDGAAVVRYRPTKKGRNKDVVRYVSFRDANEQQVKQHWSPAEEVTK
jgi:hypothetical protein